MWADGRASFERGFGSQKFVYQKWLSRIFPMVNFAFFPRWSLWSG